MNNINSDLPTVKEHPSHEEELDEDISHQIDTKTYFISDLQPQPRSSESDEVFKKSVSGMADSIQEEILNLNTCNSSRNNSTTGNNPYGNNNSNGNPNSRNNSRQNSCSRQNSRQNSRQLSFSTIPVKKYDDRRPSYHSRYSSVQSIQRYRINSQSMTEPENDKEPTIFNKISKFFWESCYFMIILIILALVILHVVDYFISRR